MTLALRGPLKLGVSPYRQECLCQRKFGPFAGDLSAAIWRNSVETEDGPRDIRSVTINPRRYKDIQSGEWRDGSYRTSDVVTLVLALQAAQLYMASHPLPQPAEEDPPDLPPRRGDAVLSERKDSPNPKFRLGVGY